MKSVGMPQLPPGAEIIDFQFETAFELTPEKMEEVNAAAKKAELAGEDPRLAVHLLAKEWSPHTNPTFYDIVVYKRMTVGRPSPLLPDPRQVPTAMIRVGELHRMPYAELKKRADELFDEAKKPAERNLQ